MIPEQYRISKEEAEVIDAKVRAMHEKLSPLAHELSMSLCTWFTQGGEEAAKILLKSRRTEVRLIPYLPEGKWLFLAAKLYFGNGKREDIKFMVDDDVTHATPVKSVHENEIEAAVRAVSSWED